MFVPNLGSVRRDPTPRGGPIVEDPINQESVALLRTRIEAKPDVVPFVGAGLSIPFGMPTWKDLLGSGASTAGVNADELIRDGAYEIAMEWIGEKLGAKPFQDFLESQLAIHGSTRELLGVVEAQTAACKFLPALTSKHHMAPTIVTTNLDRVIEAIFGAVGVELIIQTEVSATKVRKAIESGQPTLLKIHGDYADADDRILTRSDYLRHLGSQGIQGGEHPYARVLRNLAIQNSYLFLGFGLESRTLRILSSIDEQLSTHWAVLERPGSADGLARRQAALIESGVYPIWYQPGQHQQLSSFLHWLNYLHSSSQVQNFYALLKRGEYGRATVEGRRAAEHVEWDPGMEWDLVRARDASARALLVAGNVRAAIMELDAQPPWHEVLRSLGRDQPGRSPSGRATEPSSLEVALRLIAQPESRGSDHDLNFPLSIAVLRLCRALQGQPSDALAEIEVVEPDLGKEYQDALEFLRMQIPRVAEFDPSLVQSASLRRLIERAVELNAASQHAHSRAAELESSQPKLFSWKGRSQTRRVRKIEMSVNEARQAIAAYAVSTLVPRRLDWFGA